VGGELAAGIVGDETLEAVGGEGDEFRQADAVVIEGVSRKVESVLIEVGWASG